MAVLFDKNENDKYLIFLLGYLLSITDLIYFKSYLQIVSTSSILTFLISCSILFRLINYKKFLNNFLEDLTSKFTMNKK